MQRPLATLRLTLLQRCWRRLQSAVSENSTIEVTLGGRSKPVFSQQLWTLGHHTKRQDDERATAGNAAAYHAFRKYKETRGAGKIDGRRRSVTPACRPDVPARLAASTWWCGCCGSHSKFFPWRPFSPPIRGAGPVWSLRNLLPRATGQA